MKNSITISVEFFFKGEKLSPSVVIDLDDHVKHNKTIESFPPLLARSGNMDLYSYEYEMLQAEPLLFSNAQGLAKQFLNENFFDFDSFEQALSDQQISTAVAEIAKTHMAIDDLSSQPELRTTLIEAFKLGQKS